jgi:transporter family-2 protein
MNAQLGVLLKNPLVGTAVAFVSASMFTLFAVIASTEQYPQAEAIRSVPVYLWFSGGALSSFGVAVFYYLAPRMGMGPMMSYALTGQLLIAITASHFSWFGLPVRPVNLIRFAGMAAMITGIFLINRE